MKSVTLKVYREEHHALRNSLSTPASRVEKDVAQALHDNGQPKRRTDEGMEYVGRGTIRRAINRRARGTSLLIGRHACLALLCTRPELFGVRSTTCARTVHIEPSHSTAGALRHLSRRTHSLSRDGR